MSDQTQQQLPEHRVQVLEQAARLQIGMNEAIVNAVIELYAMVKPLIPEAVDGEEVQPLTGLEFVRQLQQQMQNGTGDAGVSMEQLRKWNQERRDNKQS
jgi:hypothetical protein